VERTGHGVIHQLPARGKEGKIEENKEGKREIYLPYSVGELKGGEDRPRKLKVGGQVKV